MTPHNLTKTNGNSETHGNTETLENGVITRIHTIFIEKEAEMIEDNAVFEHTDKNTGIARKMGEGEIKRMLRIYIKRVLEHTEGVENLKNSGDVEKLEKAKTVLENNIKQREYWETALKQVTGEETPQNLKIAA